MDEPLTALPNGHRAFIDRRKLTEYCLNEEKRRGRDKARVFRAALGLTAADTDWLIERLKEAARTQPAMAGHADEFGRRYRVDFTLEFRGRGATIRSGWIIRHGEDFPRLTTCYVSGRGRPMETDSDIVLLDTVVLLEPLPEAGLARGHVGTVVEVFEPPQADHVEVEFADDQGETYAMLAVPRKKLLKLREEFRKAS